MRQSAGQQTMVVAGYKAELEFTLVSSACFGSQQSVLAGRWMDITFLAPHVCVFWNHSYAAKGGKLGLLVIGCLSLTGRYQSEDHCIRPVAGLFHYLSQQLINRCLLS